MRYDVQQNSKTFHLEDATRFVESVLIVVMPVTGRVILQTCSMSKVNVQRSVEEAVLMSISVKRGAIIQINVSALD